MFSHWWLNKFCHVIKDLKTSSQMSFHTERVVLKLKFLKVCNYFPLISKAISSEPLLSNLLNISFCTEVFLHAYLSLSAAEPSRMSSTRDPALKYLLCNELYSCNPLCFYQNK